MGKVVQLRSENFRRVAAARVSVHDDGPLSLRTITAFAVLGVGFVVTLMMPAALTYVALEIFVPR